MDYKNELLHVLAEAGENGLSLMKIVKHVYNSNASLFETPDFEKMYNENGKFLYSKAGLGIAGAALGIRAGMGAIRGAFTDGEGSIDLPGIPFL